jgi:hypothetical protein
LTHIEFRVVLTTLILVLAALYAFGVVVNAVFSKPHVDVQSVATPDDLLMPREDRLGPTSKYWVSDELEFTATVRRPTESQVRWGVLRDLPPIILVLFIAWFLRGLLSTVQDGDPFSEINVKRLRLLAVTILAGVPLAGLLSSIGAQKIAESVDLPRDLSLGFTVPALVAGLLCVVLAEVFAAGVRMRDDLVGTV